MCEILATRTYKERVGARSVVWLVANASAFLPKPGGNPSEATLTALAETALAVMQLAKPGDEYSGKGFVRRLAAAAQKTFAEPQILDFYRSGPAEAAIGLLVTWLGLREYGADHVLSKDVLAAFVRARQIDETEFTLLRMLELHWTLDNIGIPHRLPSPQVLLAVGLRGKLAVQNAATMQDAEIYTFTHIVFSGTDYGRDLSLFAERTLLKSMRANALVLLDEAKKRGHWDLTGELLLTWRCLGGGERFSVDRAWQALYDAQTADGSFPAGDGTPLRDESDPRRLWALRRYHVCLVAALAAFLPCRQR